MTNIPWGPIGYPVYKRTYARDLKNGHKEEFTDTIIRVISACNKQLKCDFTEAEQKELESLFLSLKCSVAGRFLWQLGTTTVDQLGLLSLQNCSGTVVDQLIRPFTWAMDGLMLGSGVGYNIQREFVYELPALHKKKLKVFRKESNDADFIVPDSREGWVRLLKYTLEAAQNGDSFSFSTQCIRPYGQPIKGFGGVASGPEPLAEGIQNIVQVLAQRAGKKLRPVDCLDVMNIIGSIVVAGNVRRSAQIALGDMDDLQYLNAKRWDLGNVPNWRAMSNNSVVCNDIDLLPDQFWTGYQGGGEPYGLINLGLSRSCGRLGEAQYPDPNMVVYNPCAEQSLEDKETCCLAEVFLPNITSEEELRKVVKYMYIVNKHSLRLKCHHPETEEIVHKNMRMGIGVSGYCQATEAQKQWLPNTYTYLRELDNQYSDAKGWPRSIKLTTVKPSGTLSLLPGVTPGAHPGYAQYHIRRMRVSSHSDLVKVARKQGYKVEYVRGFDGKDDHSTVVIEFPSSFPKETLFAKDCTAIDQLEVVKRLQTDWSDNSVSCTVYYKKEELPAIQEWLKNNYNDGVKTVSFLLHSGHGFDQAPLEEITEEQYNEMVAKCTPITSVDVSEDDLAEDQIGCSGGVCPIR